MKPFLTITFIILNTFLFSQENPWAYEKNIMENPWLTEEQKQKALEDQRKKEAEKLQLQWEQNAKEQAAMEQAKLKEQTILDSLRKSTQNTAEIQIQKIPAISYEQRLEELRMKNVNIHDLGYSDSKKLYFSEGSGIGAYFMTLIPLFGNPIVWILSASNPSASELASINHKNREFLNDPEYKKGFKKAARNTRASKMMIGNLLGNLTKIIVFLSVFN